MSVAEFKDHYVNLSGASQYTGIPRETIRVKCDPKKTPRDHLIPSYKPGKERLIKLSELERWVQRFKAS